MAKRWLADHASRRTQSLTRVKRRRLAVEPLEGRAMLSLTHLYTFNDGTGSDTIGGADATLHNGAAALNGELTLHNVGVASGQAGIEYAALPSNLLQGTDATIEIWYTVLDSANWSRVFDIGNQNAGTGDSYFFFTAQSGFGDSRAAWHPSGSSESVATYATTDEGVQHMAVAVIDSSADLLRLYIDGTEQATAPLNGATAASINDSLAFLGRSLWDQDEGFTGLIDEVRVYDHAVSASQIALRVAEGPIQSPLPGDFNDNGIVDGADFTVWRDISGVPAGFDIWRANFGQIASDPPSLAIDNQSQSFSSVVGTQITMSGTSELHIHGSTNPLSGSVVHLESEDAWLFLHNIKPAEVEANYLKHVRVDDVVGMHDVNVRVVQHELGTVIIPHAPTFQPLEGFCRSQLHRYDAVLLNLRLLRQHDLARSAECGH